MVLSITLSSVIGLCFMALACTSSMIGDSFIDPRIFYSGRHQSTTELLNFQNFPHESPESGFPK